MITPLTNSDRPGVVNEHLAVRRAGVSAVDGICSASNRFPMVDPVSSAARMPLPRA